MPEMNPIKTAAHGYTTAHPDVIATRPPNAPLHASNMSQISPELDRTRRHAVKID